MCSTIRFDNVKTPYKDNLRAYEILVVLDGTHIPVLAPVVGSGDFKNRKGWSSYNVQVACDANYM